MAYNCVLYFSDNVYSSYEYMGCHRDTGNKRDLSNSKWEGSSWWNPVIPESCDHHCRGYLYFGLQVSSKRLDPYKSGQLCFTISFLYFLIM